MLAEGQLLACFNLANFMLLTELRAPNDRKSFNKNASSTIGQDTVLLSSFDTASSKATGDSAFFSLP